LLLISCIAAVVAEPDEELLELLEELLELEEVLEVVVLEDEELLEELAVSDFDPPHAASVNKVPIIRMRFIKNPKIGAALRRV